MTVTGFAPLEQEASRFEACPDEEPPGARGLLEVGGGAEVLIGLVGAPQQAAIRSR